MEMAKYILSILKTQPMIILSWGVPRFYAIENGLQFNVNGFLFKGTVRVVYNEGDDLFDVTLIKNGKVKETIEGVYFDCLVNTIDKKVEYGDYYKKSVYANVQKYITFEPCTENQ